MLDSVWGCSWSCQEQTGNLCFPGGRGARDVGAKGGRLLGPVGAGTAWGQIPFVFGRAEHLPSVLLCPHVEFHGSRRCQGENSPKASRPREAYPAGSVPRPWLLRAAGPAGAQGDGCAGVARDVGLLGDGGAALLSLWPERQRWEGGESGFLKCRPWPPRVPTFTGRTKSRGPIFQEAAPGQISGKPVLGPHAVPDPSGPAEGDLPEPHQERRPSRGQ